jgi:hypothetical protein
MIAVIALAYALSSFVTRDLLISWPPPRTPGESR